MCLPVMIIVAAAIAAAAAHKKANAENAVSEYQGKVAENNAKVADWQAQDAKARGDLAVAQNQRKYAAMEGSQAASLAARGLDISYGSPNAMLTDTDFFGGYDESILRANSRRDAWAFGVQAENFRNDAQLLRAQRKMNNPWVQGAFAFGSSVAGGMSGRSGSMLGNSSTVSSNWYGGTNSSAGSGSSGTWG